jgi:hypothetical protein
MDFYAELKSTYSFDQGISDIANFTKTAITSKVSNPFDDVSNIGFYKNVIGDGIMGYYSAEMLFIQVMTKKININNFTEINILNTILDMLSTNIDDTMTKSRKAGNDYVCNLLKNDYRLPLIMHAYYWKFTLYVQVKYLNSLKGKSLLYMNSLTDSKLFEDNLKTYKIAVERYAQELNKQFVDKYMS